MTFIETITNEKYILTEGSIIERIRRETDLPLDKYVENSSLLFSDNGRKALSDIYESYIRIAESTGSAMLMLSPTWRANPERLAKIDIGNVETVNTKAVHFLRSIIDRFPGIKDKLFLGGLIGCKGDAYNPDEALSREGAFAFHFDQISALANAGVDFFQAATLPALSEAIGIADILSGIKIPYLISFVVRPNGQLLDGTPLHKAINIIDKEIKNPPTKFMVNCVHPRIFSDTLKAQKNKLAYVLSRLIGLQANASALTPEELDKL